MRIAILGAGHGGHAMSADLSLAGHEINMFEVAKFSDNLAPIGKQGGIEISGAARRGFAKISKVTTDIREALDGAELVMLTTPAFAHRVFFDILAPALNDGQILISHPGNWAALEFKKMLDDKRMKKDVVLSEATSLMYACRIIGPARVWVRRVKEWMPIAAYPAARTGDVLKLVKKAYPQVVPAKNVLETSINNQNFTGHPPAMLLNAARIERQETFPFFETAQRNPPSCISNIEEALIRERIRIAEAFGVEGKVKSEDFYPSGKIEKPPPLGSTSVSEPAAVSSYPAHPEESPRSLDHRYITEDVPYGLVPMEALANSAMVQSPTITSLITMISVATGRDFRKEGLTLERLGLHGLGPKEIMKKVIG